MPPTRRPLAAPPLVMVLACVGCIDKEAADPSSIARDEITYRAAPLSRTTAHTVHCSCDADGGLRVRAPQGSQVTVPESAMADAEAEIVLPNDDGRPVRRTRSLGFIGDGKLSQSSSRGGPWNAPDALVPPHRHVEGPYGRPTFWGYRRSHPAIRPGWR